MNALKTATLAALLSTTAMGGAFAADAITTPPAPAPAAEIPVFDQGGFDWAGFYAGANIGGENDINASETNLVVGGQVGANLVYDFFLLGAELGVDAVFEEGEDVYASGEILGRAGVIVTDDLLVYGALGYDTDFDAPEGSGDHILAGGGLELAVTENVSIDGRYLYGFEQSGEVGTSDTHKFTVGANFHF